MSLDPYKVLGVPRSASDSDIKAAYRKLAKKYHPDVNPGDTEAEKRFKDISQAISILGDPEQRKRFDRGEIDGGGQQGAPGGGFHRRYYSSRGPGSSNGPFNFGGSSSDDMSGFGDLFENLFGNDMFQQRRQQAHQTQQKQSYEPAKYVIDVSFMDAAHGTTRRMDFPDGKSLDVKIPAGIEDGQSLRLKGQGGIKNADAVVKVRISPHPHFRREKNDIHLELPISVTEAALGAKVRVPTINGPVQLRIPEGSNTGRILRLKGKGIKPATGEPGDQFVTLKVMMPTQLDPATRSLIETWSKDAPYNPRAGWEDEF